MEVDTSKPPNEMMISTVPYGETPSAKAEIVLHHGQFGDGYGEEIALREAEFTGPDEASVKRKVEEWVQAQFDDVVKMLRYWR